MTGSTDTSPRPGGLVTGAVDAAVMIGLARVEKVYRGRRSIGFSALSGEDVAVSAGEMVAITSPSGSGKSPIIKLIAGIDRPTVGTVAVSSRQLDPMTEEQLAVRRGRLRGGTEIGLDRAVTGSAVPDIPAAQAALIAAAHTFAAIMTSFAAMSRHSA